MAYFNADPILGVQPIDQSSTVQNHPLGMIVRGKDPVDGNGEFIYLLGVTGTAVGNLVNWSGSATGTASWQTAISGSAASQGVSLAVAMSANTGSAYGWYAIGGAVMVTTNGTFAATGRIYLASSGNVTTTSAAGTEILNINQVTATGTPAANQAKVYINRPFAQGQII